MSAVDIPVQCCRCKNKHSTSERIDKPVKPVRGIAMSESCCPRCGARSFYDEQPWKAWCWASGLIEHGEDMPALDVDGAGAILIATGPKAALVGALGVVARRGQGASSGKLLVPGVPEAETGRAAIDALGEFLQWCAKRPSKNGVVFVVNGAPL